LRVFVRVGRRMDQVSPDPDDASSAILWLDSSAVNGITRLQMHGRRTKARRRSSRA
jgi:hypothetical protein